MKKIEFLFKYLKLFNLLYVQQILTNFHFNNIYHKKEKVFK